MEHATYIIHECSQADCLDPETGQGEEAERTQWTGMLISQTGARTLTRGRVSSECPECRSQGIRID